MPNITLTYKVVQMLCIYDPMAWNLRWLSLVLKHDRIIVDSLSDLLHVDVFQGYQPRPQQHIAPPLVATLCKIRSGKFARWLDNPRLPSLPPPETIRTYADQIDWNITQYIMEHHQRRMEDNSVMVAQMTDSFRMPKDFEMLVYLSMLLQAECIRYGVEHWRRNMHRVSGTLYWQLNDC